ncbi:hypothetical protein LWI29_035869 [Acer saccharum]|uniref:Uncharacterized protein n=1 Tax=Acer saccharum TaxID=4024 RepID=A0AA39RND7_ACESA|nr:hypothetical protein LWI29_035869 [Acer saccharum]
MGQGVLKGMGHVESPVQHLPPTDPVVLLTSSARGDRLISDPTCLPTIRGWKRKARASNLGSVGAKLVSVYGKRIRDDGVDEGEVSQQNKRQEILLHEGRESDSQQFDTETRGSNSSIKVVAEVPGKGPGCLGFDDGFCVERDSEDTVVVVTQEGVSGAVVPDVLSADRQVLLPSDENREVEDNFINSGVYVNVDAEVGDDDDDDDNVDQTEVSNKKKGKRPRRSIGSFGHRHKNKWESMGTYFDTAKEVMQARLEKVRVKSSSESSAKSCE